MASVAADQKDFEDEIRKAREYYMCKNYFLEYHFQLKHFSIDFLDGDYSKGITFYKLAIDKLRRYCQSLYDAVEKKRGAEVCLYIFQEI